MTEVLVYVGEPLARYRFPPGHPFSIDRQRAFWVFARLHGVNVEVEQPDVGGVASEPLLEGVDELDGHLRAEVGLQEHRLDVLPGLLVQLARAQHGEQALPETGAGAGQPPAQALNMESAFEQVADKLRPSVVYIKSEMGSRPTNRLRQSADDFYRRSFTRSEKATLLQLLTQFSAALANEL